MILLNGKELSSKKIDELKDKVSKLDRKLGVAIIQIGSDRASLIYSKNKVKIAEYLGYYCVYKCFDNGDKEETILEYIKELNEDRRIDGIIVELPIPKVLDKEKIINTISYKKDIDGLTSINKEYLEGNKPYLIPCTPKGIIDMLDYYNIDIYNKKVVVIGKSILVGSPMYVMLKNKGIDVVMLDSKTEDVSKYTTDADIVIVAVGNKCFLKENMVKNGSIIIDVGINSLNGKLYGDVDFDKVKEKVSYITPVPGGVGPMTLYEAMNNVYLAYLLNNKK